MKHNWEECLFEGETSLITKGTTPTSLGKEFKESGINFIKAESITNAGKFIPESFAFIDEETHEILRRSQLQVDDILFSIAGVLGRIAVVDKTIIPANTNQALALIRLSNSSKLDRDYIKYYLNGAFIKDQIRRINVQAAQANFSLGDIGRLNIQYPPLPQQKKIAKILSTVDNVIEKTESVIAKYQSIKQGLMHDLFTRGIDVNTGRLRPTPQEAPELYKESVLGLIPRDWDLDALENIANYVDYRGKTPPKSDKGIYLITAKNIKFGFIDYEISQEYILKSSYKATMSRGIPELGDVLITTEAPLGNIAQIDIEGLALAQRVIKYRCVENEMLNDFLKHSMMAEYFQKELEAESTGSTVKGIKGSRLHKLEVFKPQIDEQNSIVQSLKPIESKIQTEQQALAKYQQLKAGLLQDLLTGKVAVRLD